MGVSTVTSAGSRDPEIPALGSYVSREGSHRWGGGEGHWQVCPVKASSLWPPTLHTIKATFGEGSTLQRPECARGRRAGSGPIWASASPAIT